MKLWQCLVVAVLTLEAGSLGATVAGPLANKARVYAEWFMAGGYEQIAKEFTPDMKASITPSRLESILKSIQVQNGPYDFVGNPWFEDQVEIYTRYRVPIHFEKEIVDMRVVFDPEERVSGTFFITHIPPPMTGPKPVREERITVGNPETGLPGLLALPEGTGPFPAVLLVHGSGPSDRDETIGPNKPFRDIAWGLAKRGIASLRYDKRSYARPADLLAIGDGLTVKEEAIDDALLGLALLRQSEFVDSTAIFVLGHSLGGTVAPRIAAPSPQPAGVIILAGMALPLLEKMIDQARYLASVDGRVTPEEHARIEAIQRNVAAVRLALDSDSTATGLYMNAPIGYYRDLDSYDAPAAMAGLDIPCLVLQGDRDYQVTLMDFALWQDALQESPEACLRVFDGLDHIFHEGKGKSAPADYNVAGTFSPPVLDCIAAWVKSRECCEEP